MPESDPRTTVARATLLGILSEIPGGGGIAGAIQGAAEAASRARDEDWWAMVAARLGSLESEVQALVRFDDPDFLAALHRITRASQETSDEEKRSRLAAVLVHSGSWSEIPQDRRRRMERLVVDLSTRDVFLLRVLQNPWKWLAENEPQALDTYREDVYISLAVFFRSHLAKADDAETLEVLAAVEGLQGRRLVGLFDEESMPPTSPERQAETVLKRGRLTWSGDDFLRHLEALGI